MEERIRLKRQAEKRRSMGKRRVSERRRAVAGLQETDFFLIATVFALVMFGLLMVYSASSYRNITNGADAYGDFLRQGIFAAAGIVVMFFVSTIDYHKYTRSRTFWALIFTIFLCVLVLAFPSRNNANRWIILPFISFQPSEIAKYAIVLYFANLLRHVGNPRKKSTPLIFTGLGFVALLAFIIIEVQSNLSVGAIIFLAAMSMVFVSGANLWFVGVPALLGSAGLAAAMVFTPYRMRRFTGFLEPFADPTGSTHQLVQSLYALASGGIFGRGLSMSRLKAFWLPEAHNDFIFAVVCEELGLLGGLVLILLLALLIYRGVRIAYLAKDPLGCLMATGITAVLTFQSVINIAVVIGAFPVTGVTLPFISAGGTSLMLNLLAVGVLLNISRQTKDKVRKKTESV
jgi:cell division protein FtsW